MKKLIQLSILIGILMTSVGYGSPVLDYNSLIVYSDASTPPSSDNTIINNITPTYFFKNTVTDDFYLNLDPDNTSLVWTKVITALNIADNLPNDLLTEENLLENLPDNLQDTLICTSRNYSAVSSPAFNTNYTPSATNDVEVIASISLTSTLVTPATVNIQIDTGSGYVTRATSSLSGLVATTTQVVSFKVPKGAGYKFIQASGTSSLVSVQNLIS